MVGWTVIVLMILELADDGFTGEGFGWSQPISLTVTIFASRFFSKGVLLSKIIRLSTTDGKYP